MSDLKIYVSQFDGQNLKKLVETSKGVLRVNIDGNNVELKHGKHFHLNLKDKQA